MKPLTLTFALTLALGIAPGVPTLYAAPADHAKPAAQPATSPKQLRAVVVKIDKDGNLSVNQKPVSRGELGKTLKELTNQNPEQSVVLRPDEPISERKLGSVADICRRANVQKISWIKPKPLPDAAAQAAPTPKASPSNAPTPKASPASTPKTTKAAPATAPSPKATPVSAPSPKPSPTATPVGEAAPVPKESKPVASASKGTVDRTKKPQAGPLPAVTFPAIVTETLPNGLRVDVLASHKQPTVTFRLLIKAGDIFDGAKPGLSDLTASMLNKGTAEMSAEEFAKKIDFLGAAVEASSSEDAIAIIATGLSKDSGQLLTYLRDATLSPAFRQSDLDKEKRKMVSDLVQKKMQPDELAMRLRNKLIYGDHPYGAFATPESVQSISRDDLATYQRAQFLPNNATLVVVGDVDPATILAQAKEVFGNWKTGDAPKLDLPPFPEVKGVTYHLIDRPASVQSNIVIAGRGVPRNNPDSPELTVVNSTLGGGMSGRLFANLREKHGYTYGSYSGFSQKKLGGAFSATAEVRNAVTAPAITEILGELKRITDEPIPDTELELQRNYLTGNFLLSLESDQRIAERRQEIDLYGLPEDYYTTYAQRISVLTPEKSSELAKKYIDPNNLDIVVVGDAKEILPQLQKLGPVTVYNTDLKKTAEAPQVVEKTPEKKPEEKKTGQ